MALQVGEIAPDFAAQSTHGKISFYDWMGKSWVVLLGYPKEFTAVCAAEVRTIERLQSAFHNRGCKIIGIGVDPVDDLSAWSAEIAKSSGGDPVYPIVACSDLRVATLFDLTSKSVGEARTMRRMMIIGPDKRVRLVVAYAEVTDSIFDEILRMIESLREATCRTAARGPGARLGVSPGAANAAAERQDQGDSPITTNNCQVC